MGGQLFNKGAQAMTFVVVDEMANRFQDHKVVLFSTKDFNREKRDKEQYQFVIAPNPRYRILLLAAFSKRIPFLKKLVKDDENKKIIDYLHNADYILDISGYSLGSDWGCDASIAYCLRLKLVDLLGAKIYLMPQSFGPFDYVGRKAFQTEMMIKRCLPCARLIMAREKEGFDLLKNKYGLSNLVLTYDMVLQNRGINLKNIYKDKVELSTPLISSCSVGIIPNTKVFKYGDKAMLYIVYDAIIAALRRHRKGICFLIHSSEDRDICMELYKRYSIDNDNIRIIENELSCVEFDKTVRKFDFIIASRYHSIVHAYRNAVPAIVLSWATKYKELMETFEQEQYLFNVRETIDIQHISGAIDQMIIDQDKESAKILKGLEDVRKNNVFEFIE